MRRQAAPRPHKRDGIWYLIRRVPKDFAELDRRGIVRVSTGIAVADDPRGVRAKAIIERLSSELEIYWRGLRDGQSAEARLRFEASQQRARQLGLQYKPAAELAEAPLQEILARLRHLTDREKVEDTLEVSAVLGGEERPSLRLSDMVTEYEQLERSSLVGMSADQVRKWRNQKARAQANLIEALGDKPIAEITRGDVLQFRRWWLDRIETGGLDIATANKDIGGVSKMFETINEAHQLGLKPVFAKARLAGAVDRQRAAFTAAHVQDVILAPGGLEGLNAEALAIVWLVADTGLRLSEACNLTADTIHLDAPVPFVHVLPDGRKMKTEHSERQMPLVGVALAAVTKFPAGFPRYRDKAASLSALVNKAMKHRKMLPTEDHSLYSLRHTFEDRLTAVEAPEKVVASLMGHKWHRPKYGAGPSLVQKQEWLLRIAFKPPAASC